MAENDAWKELGRELVAELRKRETINLTVSDMLRLGDSELEPLLPPKFAEMFRTKPKMFAAVVIAASRGG